ncbi:MAG: ATP-binding cassette domain-containing protein [Clostridium sp.]
MAFIKVEDLSFSYPEVSNKALKDINIEVNEGEFVLLLGESGCGKSTLLRHLKRELTPYGNVSGNIYYKGIELQQLDARIAASEIGFVSQNPDYSIVTDKVWHELAFGLENLGLETHIIRRRVAEMASFFGIQTWFRKDVKELSGGQKQLLSLAAIMAMQPKVLILDEPTSQLDPIAAKEFLETVYKINRELGITIIITEHRLEEVFPISDRIILMDKGNILCDDSPLNMVKYISNKAGRHKMFNSLPSCIKIFEEVEGGLNTPMNIRDGRAWLNKFIENKHIEEEACVTLDDKREVVVQANELWFRYERKSDDILRGLNLEAYKGELLCILGGNGTGKSTTLGAIAGNNKFYRGEVKFFGRKIKSYKTEELYRGILGVLPQHPQSLFVKNTVELDLMEVLSHLKINKEEKQKLVLKISGKLNIESLLQSHPYDLSGGEQQKAAIAKILLLNPKVLLLDEPTKGLDGFYKNNLGEMFKQLNKEGITIIMVTHDVEFAAEYADRCALFFDGDIVSIDTTREFFSGNSFYTTAANRMSREIIPMAVTCKDVIEACRK